MSNKIFEITVDLIKYNGFNPTAGTYSFYIHEMDRIVYGIADICRPNLHFMQLKYNKGMKVWFYPETFYCIRKRLRGSIKEFKQSNF